MTDTPPAPTMNNSWRTAIAITALLFNAAIILFCLLRGHPDNSLHASALAWSYMVGIAILGGLGIGAISPDLLAAFKR